MCVPCLSFLFFFAYMRLSCSGSNSGVIEFKVIIEIVINSSYSVYVRINKREIGNQNNKMFRDTCCSRNQFLKLLLSECVECVNEGFRVFFFLQYTQINYIKQFSPPTRYIFVVIIFPLLNNTHTITIFLLYINYQKPHINSHIKPRI